MALGRIKSHPNLKIFKTKKNSSKNKYEISMAVSFKIQLADHEKLNPHRFETVFYNKSQDLECFASYRLSNYQFKSIFYGILIHSRENLEVISQRTKKVIMVFKHQNKIMGALIGFASKESFFIENLQFDNREAAFILLSHLKSYLCKQQIDHASTDIIAQNDDAADIYRASGFTCTESLTGEFIFKITTNKLLPDPESKKDTSDQCQILEFADHAQGNLFYKQLTEQCHFKSCNETEKEYFGLFLQTNNHQIVGGLIGILHPGFLTVDRLWIDEFYRGHQFSKQLVSLAENYAMRRQRSISSLHTMQYHAPWLYPKLGYKVFFQQQIGPYAGFYYEKVLRSRSGFFQADQSIESKSQASNNLNAIKIR